MSLDERLFTWINGFIGESAVYDAAVRLLVNEYIVPVTLSLAVLYLWFGAKDEVQRDKWQSAVLVAALAVGIANAVVKLNNLLYFRERPFAGVIIDQLFYKPIDSSFPSNAAALAFALSAGVWMRDRRVGTLLLPFAALFPLARVAAGVHYPSDILAGALVGVASAVTASYLVRRLAGLFTPLVAAARRLGVA